MKLFAYIAGSDVGIVTVSTEGAVKLFRHFSLPGSDVLRPLRTSEAHEVFRNARPLQGKVNDDLRIALEAALKEAFAS